MEDVDLARRLEDQGARLVIYGGLVTAGDSVRATAALLDVATGRTVAEFEERDLAARIDRLSPEERGLLQVASVVGETVPLAILQAVAEMPDDVLQPALAHLRAAEFLYEGSLYPDLEYTFKHGLTYQVAYNSLLLERRRD